MQPTEQQIAQAYRTGAALICETLQVSTDEFAKQEGIRQDVFNKFLNGADNPGFTPDEARRILECVNECLDAAKHDTGLSPFDQIRLYAEAREKRNR